MSESKRLTTRHQPPAPAFDGGLSWMPWLADDLAVLSMGADPDPADPILDVDAKCPIVITDPHWPKLADSFEVKVAGDLTSIA